MLRIVFSCRVQDQRPPGRVVFGLDLRARVGECQRDLTAFFPPTPLPLQPAPRQVAVIMMVMMMILWWMLIIIITIITVSCPWSGRWSLLLMMFTGEAIALEGGTN
jgi:hypothetical protein